MKRLVPLLAALAVAALCAAAASAFTPSIFDVVCSYHHSLSDDPLKLPGQPGASHLHDFFANPSTNAFSTPETMLAAHDADVADDGRTNCDELGDGAGYWVPALWRDGAKLIPSHVHLYRRGDTHGTEITQAPPNGLGMIASRYGFTCGDRAGESPTPVICDGVRRSPNVTAVVNFPEYWDGWRLFAQDGSHVSYKKDVAHPVRIPKLTLIVNYGKVNLDGGHTWELGPMPDGMFMPVTAYHADDFEVWDRARIEHLVSYCLNNASPPAGLNRICHDPNRR